LFVSEAVDEFDLSEIFEYYERSDRGYPPYHPTMMVKVIVYGYCIGVRSGRRIQRALYEDVAFRVLGAGNFPDFRTICDFRKIHLKTLEGLFVQVLAMCEKTGLVKLGTVALDGTKMKANASLDNTKTYKKIVKDIFKEAQEIDEMEDRLYGPDNSGYELPEGLRTRKERLERFRKAKKEIEEEQRKKHEQYDEKVQERTKQEKETGKKKRGRKPKPVPEEPDNKKKRNTTDPDSRIMKTRKGFIQGFNGQIAVDTDTQVIVGQDVTQDENDKHQLAHMMENVEKNTGRKPKRGTMDSGYWTEKEIEAVPDDIDLYITTTKDWKQRKKMRENPSPRGRIPKDTDLQGRMERKLLTMKGRAIYKKRGASVEPVFGQIKDARGIDRFHLRGIDKVKGEWSLITMTHNLLKLWRHNVGA